MVVRFHPNSDPFLTPTRHSKSPRQKAYAHSAHLPAMRETRNGSDAPALCQETQLEFSHEVLTVSGSLSAPGARE